MKALIFIPQALLTLALLSSCSSDPVAPPTTVVAGVRGCGPAESQTAGVQPERGSIENLFGCVTFSYTSSSSEDTFDDSVLFSAASEGEPIFGGRTVSGMAGRSPVECVEITFGPLDFLCVVRSPFGTTDSVYNFTMTSQFEGTGTHQICFQSNNECGLNGVEFPKDPATITIVRNGTITAGLSAMNGQPVTVSEAIDHKLADAMQFGTIE